MRFVISKYGFDKYQCSRKGASVNEIVGVGATVEEAITNLASAMGVLINSQIIAEDPDGIVDPASDKSEYVFKIAAVRA